MKDFFKSRLATATLTTVLGGLLGAACFAIAFFEAAGGHGTYLPAKLFFPYSMYVAMAALGHITPGLLTLAAIQFPTYGLLIGLSSLRRTRFQIGVALLLIHISAASLCVYKYSGNFYKYSGNF